MAKTNIIFNDTEYSIDESYLVATTNNLQSHLSTVMNGTGATINLGGISYNIDSTKLADATNDFVSHLGTIAGTGHKVVVGGVEYGVDSDKVAGSVSDMQTVLSGLESGGGNGNVIVFNGNINGKDSFEVPEGDYFSTYVKISDNLPTIEELNAATYSIKIINTSSGEIEERTYGADGETGMVVPFASNLVGVVVPSGLDFLVAYDGGDFEVGTTLSIPSAGVYVFATYGSVFSSRVYSSTTYAEIVF